MNLYKYFTLLTVWCLCFFGTLHANTPNTLPGELTCNSQLAYWDLDGCTSYTNDGSNYDYSEFTASTNAPNGISSVNATNLTANGPHSCTYGASGEALCHGIMDNCSWSDNSSQALTFTVTVNPSSGYTANISGLSFYEAAPLEYSWIDGASGDNDPPSKYGIRVLKNGNEIFESINNSTTHSWSLEQFDFSNDPDFTVSGQTTFTFELLGYCRSNGTSGYAVWDVDEIKVYGCAEVNDPCAGQGGDSDNDGTCDNQDCQPNNPNFPAAPGSACNDGDPNTINDVVTSDGCGCAGTPTGNDCDNISITCNGNGTITVTGLGAAPVSQVQVFNASWQTVYNCAGNCSSTENISVGNGDFYVYAKLFNSSWQLICETSETVTCTGGDPCAGQGGDSDNDGVCNNQDCQPYNPNFPATPGSACDDGNPNTSNDMVTSDGCGCAGTPTNPCDNQGGDSDNDGVCNNQDCQPYNPNFPATPGSACNDGDPNTSNDVVTSDGCGCEGTPTGNDCDDISITCNGNGTITVTGLGGAPVSQLQVFSSSWQTVYNCAGNCDPTETVSVGNGDYYVYAKLFTSGWQLICQVNETVTCTGGNPCDNQGGDSDNDGVCNNQDCQPYNPNFPATPGSACDDGNPNTSNDMVTSDGCGCAGTPTNPCDNQGGDSDNDGVCNNQDCQPYNPNFPATPGSACNDGDPNTSNDVVTSDGCGCEGTPTGNDCDDISITCNGNGTITVTGLGGAPVSQLQVFSSSWQTVYNCAGNCDPTETVSVGSGDYYVYAKLFTSGWQLICQVNETVTCTGGNPCDNQGGDSDNDGVCNNQDCQPYNPNFPATPGSACDDGNPNTSNDMVTSDGCGCAGTPTNPCDNQGGDSDNDGVCNNQDCQPYNPNFPATPGSACNDGDPNTSNDMVTSDGCGCEGTPTSNDCDNISISCNGNGTITVTGLGAAPVAQLQVFNTSWQTVFNCSGNCNSTENISVGNGNYYVYAKLFTSGWQLICETTETVTCTVTDPCANQGGDSDNDGVCNNQDCQPNNPNFPATPGSACDDGNPNTSNDVVSSDGCGCAGTPVIPPCNPTQIAHWDLDACVSFGNDGTNLDYSEFTANTNTPSGFSNVSASLLTHDGAHSCTYGQSGAAICSGIRDNCSWQDNSSGAFRFSVTVNPTNGGTVSLTKLSFYEAAPLTYSHISGNTGDNDPPSHYGFRVLKNGTEIYQNTGNNTTHSWSLEEFDLTNDPDFVVTSQTTFEFELLGYCRSNGTSGLAVWDLDEIKVHACAGDGYNSPLQAEESEDLYFQALKNGRDVSLYWVTNTEYKNDYFEVERSFDGINFETIEEVISVSESTGHINYTENDADAKIGANYYRIKQVFNDGSFVYSVVKQVNFDIDVNEFSIFPNPAADEVFVNLKDFVGNIGMIQLHNSLGQTIKTIDVGIVPEHPVRISLEDLKAGTHAISVHIEGKKIMSKILIISKL